MKVREKRIPSACTHTQRKSQRKQELPGCNRRRMGRNKQLQAECTLWFSQLVASPADVQACGLRLERHVKTTCWFGRVYVVLPLHIGYSYTNEASDAMCDRHPIGLPRWPNTSLLGSRNQQESSNSRTAQAAQQRLPHSRLNRIRLGLCRNSDKETARRSVPQARTTIYL